MKIADAIATVNRRPEFETYTETFTSEVYNEAQTFIQAARVCATHATPQPALAPELADALSILVKFFSLNETNTAITGSMITDAIATVRRYLPPAPATDAPPSVLATAGEIIAAAERITLPQAAKAIENLAGKRDEEEKPLGFFPSSATTPQLAYYARTLGVALRVLERHGAELTNETNKLVAQAQNRLDTLNDIINGDNKTNATLAQWAEFVDSSVYMLDACWHKFEKTKA